MIKALDKLAAQELETLARAPLLVCILIAGADNEIDDREIKGAIKLVQNGARNIKDSLGQFLGTVTEDIEDKLKIVMHSFPSDARDRNPMLFDELRKLNKILPKIDKSFASNYYRCLLQIAKKIAESSGGLLGIQAVGEEEGELIGLPMIKNPSSV